MKEDWIECELGEVVKTIDGDRGKNYPNKSEFTKNGFCLFLSTKNVRQGQFVFDDNIFISKEKDTNLRGGKVEINDIILTTRGTLGNVALFDENVRYKNIRINSGMLILRIKINNLIIPNYLMKFIVSPLFFNQLKSKQTGTAQPQIPANILKNILVNLPPLPIQRAIVSKIEALFSDLDNGIANFKKAQAQLKIYRQAVLKKAFEGEPTKEWRENIVKMDDLPTVKTHGRASQLLTATDDLLTVKTDDLPTVKTHDRASQLLTVKTHGRASQLPTAEELLQQIKQERQNHYDQQVEDWKKAVKEWEKNGSVGKRPSKPSQPKEFPNVKESDVETYENLPSAWKWSKFGNVTYKIGDIDHKMPKTVSNGYPYLSTGDLNKDGTIDFVGAKTISKEDFDRLALKIKPEKGDIIFPRYGTIGRNILIDFDKEFLVSYACAIIKNITNLMSSKFALYYSLSPVIKKEIKRYTVETTQANIGIASIENFVFPLCSTEEQHQIVQEIERRLSVCDKMEQSIKESIEKAEALRQSILKKAFEGKLLSQAEIAQCKKEADYEPASELLKRIKAEKLAKEQALRQAQGKKQPIIKKQSNQ